jgi:hypothetical protein
LAARAIAAAKMADVVIYIGGLNHDKGFDCEGADRKDMKLPYGQDELISKIVAANPKTIVVLEGTMVEMDSWLDQVPAVLQAWYPGMEGGNALAGILFGDVNPSGKLPCTIPKRLEDSPAHALGAYPGVNGTVTYSEGLLVGYRWFDTKNIEPQFPFGFGLSYTTFEYSNLKLVESNDDANGTILTAQFEIKNTGSRAGAEVAELYVHQNNPSLPRPEKELKGFAKVFLKPGETQNVSIPLDKNAFAFYNPDQKSWVAEKGAFQISVGGSSRDLPLKGEFTSHANHLLPIDSKHEQTSHSYRGRTRVHRCFRPRRQSAIAPAQRSRGCERRLSRLLEFLLPCRPSCDFDPVTHTGKIVWQRSQYSVRHAFDNELAGLIPAKPNEFPDNEYEANPALPFSIDFVSPKTIRIRLTSGPQYHKNPEELMLAGEVPHDDSWKYEKVAGGHRYTSPFGSVTIMENPWHIEIRDASGKLLTQTDHASDNKSTFTPVLPFSFVRRSSDYSRSINAAFTLSPGEKIFGCGESFTGLDKRGQKIVLWTR